MRVTVLLATTLVLCSAGCAMSQTNQTTCTAEQLQTFVNVVTDLSACLMNVNRLGETAVQLLNSITEGQKPDQDLVDEADELIGKVCVQSCIGGANDLLQECTPPPALLGGFDLEDVDSIIALCSSNGTSFCVLEIAQVTDFELYTNTFNICPFQWISGNGTCPSGCKETSETVIDEIGCCINGVIDQILSNSSATTQDYYTACQIKDPGMCSTKLVDQNGGTVPTAAKGLSLLAVLITVAVGIF